jgi:hypothetical protein
VDVREQAAVAVEGCPSPELTSPSVPSFAPVEVAYTVDLNDLGMKLSSLVDDVKPYAGSETTKARDAVCGGILPGADA